jgi:hypothetical protein
MAESHSSLETGRGRNVYPAIAVAAIAGIAITYLVMRKSKGVDEALPVEKVVNLCNSAAEKLDKFVSQALAS